jgi:peptidoglycan/xylan/chitin deacetylase (PgdA/CDA1 family)
MIQSLLVHHTPLSYSDAVNKVLSGNIDKPYITFSSDDGFKNNLWAADILKRYGISGCFFINPTSINATSFSEIKEFCAQRLNLPPVEFMNWDDVAALLKDGHEIGSHTQDHVKISEISADIAKENIDKSSDEIKMRCGKVEHFAYPYGRYHHFNEEMRQFVFDRGFLSCASAERGCHITDGKPLRNDELFIRRDHVILDWDLRHIVHFLVRNSKKANLALNFSPYSKQ